MLCFHLMIQIPIYRKYSHLYRYLKYTDLYISCIFIYYHLDVTHLFYNIPHCSQNNISNNNRHGTFGNHYGT